MSTERKFTQWDPDHAVRWYGKNARCEKHSYILAISPVYTGDWSMRHQVSLFCETCTWEQLSTVVRAVVDAGGDEVRDELKKVAYAFPRH